MVLDYAREILFYFRVVIGKKQKSDDFRVHAAFKLHGHLRHIVAPHARLVHSCQLYKTNSTDNLTVKVDAFETEVMLLKQGTNNKQLQSSTKHCYRTPSVHSRSYHKCYKFHNLPGGCGHDLANECNCSAY